MKPSTLEYPYQVIAYLDEPQLGTPVGPPWRAHVTVKRRFKLRGGATEDRLASVLQDAVGERSPMGLCVGQERPFGEDNMVLDVLNADEWSDLNKTLVSALRDITETRDPQFEGKNASPHLTTNFRGDVVAEAKDFAGREFEIKALWLVKEHPEGATSAVAIRRLKLGGLG